MRSPLAATLAVTAALACAACAHPAPTDPVLAAMEAGFSALRRGDNAKARVKLGRALRHFDDLALDGSALERAFASDPNKPYRGRPHERVLTALVVAALDAEAGRCDMVDASLKNARYLMARLDRAHEPPLPLADAIADACGGATDVTLVFTGSGPSFSAAGAEQSMLVVAPGDPAGAAGTIRIGTDRHGAGERLWSSTMQARTIGDRPFQEVLDARAAARARQLNSARTVSESATEVLLTDARDGALTRDAVVRGFAGISWATVAFAAGSAIDARVDTRHVTALPEGVRAVR